MADAVIDNPILNSPFDEPERHWKFERDGITNEIVDGRRVSSYFMPIPKSKRGGDQLQFETEWTSDRIEENRTINRDPRARWSLAPRRMARRHAPRPDGCSSTGPIRARDRKLFFAQIEAVETAIYIGEVINKGAHQDAWITNFLREAATDANPGLFRVALKMATGTGKTVVMAMLIAWQALNKAANKQDARFSDAFLLVSPGITIRDRLRVLLPESPDNYYRERDLIPPGEQERLGQARIVVTNFHGFLLRDRSGTPKVTKQVLAGRNGRPNPLQETSDQMARRVCRTLGSKRGIIVINDEAHHCYRHRVGGEAEDFLPEARTAESKQEVKEREEEARIWISGLEAINAKVRHQDRLRPVRHALLPRRLRLSRGRLFPWVVSDFALIDAIEAGHREGAARPGVRQRRRRHADLPQPLDAHPQRPAKARRAPAGPHRPAPTFLLPWRPPFARSTPTTSSPSSSGRRWRPSTGPAPRRRSSSSSATTRASPSSSSTGLPAGSAKSAMTARQSRSRAALASVLECRRGRQLARAAEQHRRRLRPARVRRGDVGRVQEGGRRRDRAVQG